MTFGYSNMHWAMKYLGLPYREGADGPDSYDCWGLMREICKERIDCHMPLINVGRNDNQIALVKAIRGWTKVKPPYREYDILTMKGAFGRHVGMCIKANNRILMIHAEVPQVQVTELNRLSRMGYKDVQGWRYGTALDNDRNCCC